jgi:hypothetical protein
MWTTGTPRGCYYCAPILSIHGTVSMVHLVPPCHGPTLAVPRRFYDHPWTQQTVIGRFSLSCEQTGGLDRGILSPVKPVSWTSTQRCHGCTPDPEESVPIRLCQAMPRTSSSCALIQVFLDQANSEDFLRGSSCGSASLSVPLMVSRTMW